MIVYKLAGEEDLEAMTKVGDSLFDFPIKKNRAQEFLQDDRHHLVLAFDDDKVIGMASGFHYVHPDKDPELFINEVGVLDDYQNQGIGRRLVKKMIDHGKRIGCVGAWIATDRKNLAARKSFLAAGGEEVSDSVVLISF